MAERGGPNTSTSLQSSPLAKTVFPFKNPRTLSPCASRYTTERQATVKVEKRETACATGSFQTLPFQHSSGRTVLDIINSCDLYAPPTTSLSPPTNPATVSPPFGSSFQASAHHKRCSDRPASTTVAICKTCKQDITSAFGICEKCKKTIVLPSHTGEVTRPLTRSCRNFASTDLTKLHKESASGSSSKFGLQQPNFMDPFIPLSSLLPPPNHDMELLAPEMSRTHKISLADLDEPFLPLQMYRKSVPHSHPSSPTTPPPTPITLPSTPTTVPSPPPSTPTTLPPTPSTVPSPPPSTPATPPSTPSTPSTVPSTPPPTPVIPPGTLRSHTSNSNGRTRPFSLANLTTPPQYLNGTYSNGDASITSSEPSIQRPRISTALTSPESLCQASYELQNTTSAWDEWDSDGSEKLGLLSFCKSRIWRTGKGSTGGTDVNVSLSVDRGSAEKEELLKEEGMKRRMSAIIRAISCGHTE